MSDASTPQHPPRPTPTPTPPAASPTRRMDARSLRGVAHPLRMRILELLRLDGPDTATGLGRRLGENTGTVSWHLRHLAEHGFIEEETGRGTKRERWWRAVRVAHRLDTTEFRDDPDTRGALTLYVHEIVQQHFNRVVSYLTEDWAPEWREAGTLSQWHDLLLTPRQLAALNDELEQVVARHRAAAHSGSGEGTSEGTSESAPEGAPERTREGIPEGTPEERPIVVQLQAFPRKERDER